MCCPWVSPSINDVGSPRPNANPREVGTSKFSPTAMAPLIRAGHLPEGIEARGHSRHLMKYIGHIPEGLVKDQHCRPPQFLSLIYSTLTKSLQNLIRKVVKGKWKHQLATVDGLSASKKVHYQRTSYSLFDHLERLQFQIMCEKSNVSSV